MFCKGPKVFRSRCKNYKNSRLFSKKSSKPSSGLAYAVLTPLGKSFFPKTKNVLVKVPRSLKNQNFSQKKFSICFPGHVNCGFGNPIVNCLLNRKKSFPPIDQNGSLKAQKAQENHHFQMCFSSKTSSGHEEWSSEKHTANFLPKVQDFFCSKDDNFSLKAREVLRNHSFCTTFCFL